MRSWIFVVLVLALLVQVLHATRTVTETQVATHARRRHAGHPVNVEAVEKFPGVGRSLTEDSDENTSSSGVSYYLGAISSTVASYALSGLIASIWWLLTLPFISLELLFLCIYNPFAAVALFVKTFYPAVLVSMSVAICGTMLDVPISFLFPRSIRLYVIEPIKLLFYLLINIPLAILYVLNACSSFLAHPVTLSVEGSTLEGQNESKFLTLSNTIHFVELMTLYVYPQELGESMHDMVVNGLASIRDGSRSFILNMPYGFVIIWIWDTGLEQVIALYEATMKAKELVGDYVEKGRETVENVVHRTQEMVENGVEAGKHVANKTVEVAEAFANVKGEYEKLPTKEEADEKVAKFLADSSHPVLLENIEIPVGDITTPLPADAPEKKVPVETIHYYRPMVEHAQIFAGGTSTAVPMRKK